MAGIVSTLKRGLAAGAIKRLSPYQSRQLAMTLADQGRPEAERQSFECPLCGYVGRFNPFFGADAIRFDAHCPQCGSRERHRFIKLWLDRDPRGARFGRLIHFAPERELRPILRDRAEQYQSADIDGRADLTLNMEEIALERDSVDTIVANHVLEHVDDSKALGEMLRVLRPGGFAILTTPAVYSWADSYEDPAIEAADARYRHFGQADHVRYFGQDVEARIRAAGFDLDVVVAGGADTARYALLRGEALYIATKPT